MLIQRGGRIFSVLEVCSFLAVRFCYCYLVFLYYSWAKPLLIVLLSKIMGGVVKGSNGWGGWGFDDFVRGKVAKTVLSGDETS